MQSRIRQICRWVETQTSSLDVVLKVRTLQFSAAIFAVLPRAFGLSLMPTIAWVSAAIFLGLRVERISRRQVLRNKFLDDEFLVAVNSIHERLLEDEQGAHYKERLRNCLKVLMESLGSRYETHMRASIYVRGQHTSTPCFHLIARYSDQPDLNEVGRPTCPDDGIVGHAWRENEYHINHLPDPSSDEDRWRSAQLSDAGLNAAEVVDSLSMRSREYFGCAIRDRRNDSKIGVLVLESTEPQLIKPSAVRQSLQTGFAQIISEYLDRQKEYFPDPQLATTRGF